ncbi:hypothetical protein BC629DRAFT_915738 [Irpex lacteus]|nr:hypothetical protein BC629DRAFT_915738 [Irpex lacteus]
MIYEICKLVSAITHEAERRRRRSTPYPLLLPSSTRSPIPTQPAVYPPYEFNHTYTRSSNIHYEVSLSTYDADLNRPSRTGPLGVSVKVVVERLRAVEWTYKFAFSCRDTQVESNQLSQVAAMLTRKGVSRKLNDISRYIINTLYDVRRRS